MIKEASAKKDDVSTIVEFLSRFAPFEQMSKGDRQFLAGNLTLKQFEANEVILSPEQGPAQYFFIVKSGRVVGGLQAGAVEEPFWEIGRGDFFPIAALIASRPVNVLMRAVEDTQCYRMSRQDFETLRRRSPEFQEFCTRRISSLLDLALRDLQTQLLQREVGGSLTAPLHDLIGREPVTCSPETPLRVVLAQMEAERVPSVVVVDEEFHPIGMFTLRDLLTRVALAECSLDRQVGEVMTHQPATLDAELSGFSAALLMADRGFGQVCVIRAGSLVGLITEADLFSVRRLGLAHLRRSIREAKDTRTLAVLGRDVHSLIDLMLAQGASVEQVTQIITALNDHIARRAIELILMETGAPDIVFSWIAFGSEGRHEQTLKTDQDNGILFQVPAGMTADQVRAQLLPLADRINTALEECGVPRCRGGVMAGNPDWCLSQDEWSEKFSLWVNHADGKKLLYATIFFDFRCLFGPEEPVEDLRTWLLGMVKSHRNFFRHMVEQALGTRPPLGLLRDFVVKKGGDAPHTLDLKLNGITPFVDTARIFALSAGIRETNTPQRLRAAGLRWRMNPSEVEAWLDGFHYIQLTRLLQQRDQGRRGIPLTNDLNPDSLNELERRILKESFQQARKLQRRLEQYFQF